MKFAITHTNPKVFTITQISPPFGLPDNLVTVVYSHSQINLIWVNHKSGEDGFSIECCPLGGSYSVLGTAIPGATTFSATGLTGNTFYSFRVHAYKGTDYSVYSNIASATTMIDNTSAINLWQNTSTTNYISGTPSSYWSGAYCIPQSFASATTPYTVIEKAHAIRQKGYIYSIEILVYAINAPGGQDWEFKLFEYVVTTGLYRCKASIIFNPVGSGVVNNKQTFILSSPILAEEGDIPGLLIPLRCAACPGQDAYGFNYRTTPVPKYVEGDIALGQSNVFSNNAIWSVDPLGLFLLITTYGINPYSVFLGDSIFSGGNHGLTGEPWNTDQESSAGFHTPGGSPGVIDYAIAHRLSLRMPVVWRYQNFAASGHTLDMITQSNSRKDRAVLANPKQVFIHCGINDIYFYGPTDWSLLSARLDLIRTSFPGGTEFFLDEILPVSSADDTIAALIRATNVHYAAYCTSHSWTLIACHDSMGSIRISTGFYDDLNILYDSGDNLHLNLAGVDNMAEIIRTYL
jgi:hypothetical protein